MKNKTTNILLLLLFTPLVTQLNAQEYKYEVGIATGVNSYLGDANPAIPFATPGATAMVQARYNINFRMVAFVGVQYNLFRGNSNVAKTVFPQNSSSKFSTASILFTPAFEYNFYPYSDKYPFLQTKRLTPYISLGLAVGVGLANQAKPFVIPGLSGALGLKYKVANRLNLQLQLGGMHFFTDKLEGASNTTAFLNNPYGIAKQPWKGNDGAINVLVGITYEFGQQVKSCNNL